LIGASLCGLFRQVLIDVGHKGDDVRSGHVKIPGGHGVHAGGVEVDDQEAWPNPVKLGGKGGEGSNDRPFESQDKGFDAQRLGRRSNFRLEDQVVEDGHDSTRRAILAHVPRLVRPLDATLSIRRSTAKVDIINTSDDPQSRARAMLSIPSG